MEEKVAGTVSLPPQIMQGVQSSMEAQTRIVTSAILNVMEEHKSEREKKLEEELRIKSEQLTRSLTVSENLTHQLRNKDMIIHRLRHRLDLHEAHNNMIDPPSSSLDPYVRPHQHSSFPSSSSSSPPLQAVVVRASPSPSPSPSPSSSPSSSPSPSRSPSPSPSPSPEEEAERKALASFNYYKRNSKSLSALDNVWNNNTSDSNTNTSYPSVKSWRERKGYSAKCRRIMTWTGEMNHVIKFINDVVKECSLNKEAVLPILETWMSLSDHKTVSTVSKLGRLIRSKKDEAKAAWVLEVADYITKNHTDQ
jgi:hypothetical protein